MLTRATTAATLSTRDSELIGGPMAIVAAAIALMFVGATLPTPLYPLYRETFGFSGVMLTLIYAVYVLGNMVALLIFGRLSDQIGRRSISLASLAFALVSTFVFLFAQGTAWLFVARVISGFSTGLGAGAVTAWIAELATGRAKAQTAQIATVANYIGLAAGAVIAGLLATFASWPLRLPYAVYLVLLLAMAAAITLPPETVADRKRGLAQLSLRPRVGVPREIRLAFVPPAVTAFAVFSLLGFYAALIPTLLSQSMGQTSPAVSGGVVCELFVVASLAVIATGRLSSRTAMLSGIGLLVPSLWLLVAAEWAHSMPLLLIATAAGGISGALGYRGSLAVVNDIAPADRRSEVVSSYLVAVYCGNSIPVVGIGLLSAAVSATAAHFSLAVLITALAAIAFAVARRAD
jgi:MFS family permease